MQLRSAHSVFLLLLLISAGKSFGEEKLLTVAEKSDYKATARHAEVVDFCQRLAKMSPLSRLSELGVTLEKRKIPLVIIADPPIATAAEAATSDKLVVFAMGNIHAGEVDGKEALLMLARDIALDRKHPLLHDLILVIAPIFNADGNERMSKTNRPGQLGPAEGMGIRENAQGMDLNRDFIKLETPEVRALVRFCTDWNPSFVIDAHTTNGSHHRYTITYEGPRNPAGDAKLIETVRDQLFPAVGKKLEKRGGYKSFFYGNFSRDRSRWESVPPIPRFGLHYLGLRNQIGILVESYSYATYRDRVLASRDFILSIFEYAAENKGQLQTLLADARKQTIDAGRQPMDAIALRALTLPLNGTFKLLGFVEETRNGRRVATDKTRDYAVQYFGRSQSALSVRRPFAYIFPASMTKVVEKLQEHGIEVEELREVIELPIEVYRLAKVAREQRPFQNHHTVTVDATVRSDRRRPDVGSIVVRTGQPLGNLVAYLLEPQAEDGLCTWNFFDEALAADKDFPVLRIPAPATLSTQPLRPSRAKNRQTRTKHTEPDA